VKKSSDSPRFDPARWMRLGSRATKALAEIAVFLFAATPCVATAAAQQVTGELGASTATTIVNGKQLPAPPPTYEIGRVIQNVQDMGKLDNTLIIYIDGDNCTSPEGSLYNQMTAYNGILSDPAVKPVKLMNALHYKDLGFRQELPAYGGAMGVGI
jgi:hypothetical protein